MKDTLSVIKEHLLVITDFVKAYGFVFLPSVTLVLGGLAVFARPDLLIPVLATFFVTLGGAAVCFTWKMILLRERVQEIVSKFDGRIFIHGVQMQGGEEGVDPMDPNDDPSSQILH